MDAWFESLVLAMAVVAVGIAALGPRFELWHPARLAVNDMKCVPLHASAGDHQPKCATAVSPGASPVWLVRN